MLTVRPRNRKSRSARPNATTQSYDQRTPPPTLGPHGSLNFTLHPSSFIFHPSSFILSSRLADRQQHQGARRPGDEAEQEEGLEDIDCDCPAEKRDRGVSERVAGEIR